MKYFVYIIPLIIVHSVAAVPKVGIGLGTLTVVIGVGMLSKKNFKPLVQTRLIEARKNYLDYIESHFREPGAKERSCLDSSGDYEVGCHQEWHYQSRLFLYNSLLVLMTPHLWFKTKKKS